MMLPICCILLPKWMGNPGEFLGQSWESRGKVLGACWANVGKFLGKGWGPDSQNYPRSFPAFALDFPRIFPEFPQDVPRIFPTTYHPLGNVGEFLGKAWGPNSQDLPKISLCLSRDLPMIFPC